MCGFISLELNIYEELTGKGALRFAPPTCHRRAERMKKIYLSVERVYRLLRLLSFNIIEHAN